MTAVDVTIHHKELCKREELYMSENYGVCFPEIFCIINPHSSSTPTTSYSSIKAESIVSSSPQPLADIVENFRSSINNRTCDINTLNRLEIAINNGIDRQYFQLLNYEFNKVFLVCNWPEKWYSRVLANAIFLSAYFKDSNLAVSCSNCFKTFTLLDNFHLHSDVIFNSIANSLAISGNSWDQTVYNAIIEFSLAFTHIGSDSLWEIITSIIYKIAPRIELDVFSTLTGDELGLGYYFNGLIVSRTTIAIISYVKGVLDETIKAITEKYSKTVVIKVKQCLTDVMGRIITYLPNCDRFIEDMCKMSELPENVVAVYIIRQFVKSSTLTIDQLVLIGLWCINCSKAIHSKWQKYLVGLDKLHSHFIDGSTNDINNLDNSEPILVSNKLRDMLGDGLLVCDINVLCQMEHINLTNYQSHVWASLILMDQHDANLSFFDCVVPYLKFSYSNQHSNKCFTSPIPSAVFYSLICDIPRMIMHHLQCITLDGEGQLNIVSGLQKFISEDPTLIDSTLFNTLQMLCSHKDYKVRLKLAQILLCCIHYDKMGDMVENITLVLLCDKSASVRLAAVNTFHRIVTDYNYTLQLDTIKHIARVYVGDTNKSVCHVALQILSNFFFCQFIESSDKYDIKGVIEVLLCHLYGRKSLISYYNGLDFTQNPIKSMNKICNCCQDHMLDFWYNYLVANIKASGHNRIELLYVIHLFSDVFRSYYLGKIHELVSLFKYMQMDDQTYHLLVELICKNMDSCVDYKLKGELVHFVNYDRQDNSNIVIQSKMKLCVMCNIDVTGAIVAALDAITTLSLALYQQNELPLVNQSDKVSIWKLGSILQYLPQISYNLFAGDPTGSCAKVASDLLNIGLGFIGHDDNLLIIIICSMCSYISHFDNIQHLDMQKFALLMQKSMSWNKTLAVAVLVTMRKFYSLKFNSKYNRHADGLGNLFTSLIHNNLSMLLYKSGRYVRHWCLIILQGLIR